jgi:ribosomal protein S18 acetylase RimI-like enzyme
LADASDLADIAALFLECWLVSYADVLPDSLVGSMTPSRAHEIWASALSNPELTILIATPEPGDVHGLVGFRQEPDGSGYVSSLYVSPRSQGRGFGGRLLREAETGLLDAGAAHGRLWVFAANHPSIRFYERHGWALDGRETTLAEWGEPQLGMTKPLGM